MFGNVGFHCVGNVICHGRTSLAVHIANHRYNRGGARNSKGMQLFHYCLFSYVARLPKRNLTQLCYARPVDAKEPIGGDDEIEEAIGLHAR